jgi:hypothetical protein
MHTGQFRVVRIHRSRFPARVVQKCGLTLHETVAPFLLQGCGSGSSDSSSSNLIPLKIGATSVRRTTGCVVLIHAYNRGGGRKRTITDEIEK